MPSGQDFHVEPEDLGRAGNSATEIGDRISRDSDDLLPPARNVSGGLDGFALAGVLSGCAQAWDDELESVADKTRGAGELLLSTARTYEQGDAGSRDGFDSFGQAHRMRDGGPW